MQTLIAFTGTLALGCLALGMAGCASRVPDAGVSQSRARVASDVSARTGTTLHASGAGAGAGATTPDAQAAVRALLAQPLTEASAVKVALLANPEVRSTYERLGLARADLLQAGLLTNPVFAFDVFAFDAGTEIETSLAQSFVELFYLPLRKSVAAADLRAEEAAVARDLVRLVHDVKRAFVRVHAAESVVALSADALQRAEASSTLMLQLHAAGNALDTVRTVEEAAAARAKLHLDGSRLHALEARETLSVLLGCTGRDVSWTLAGALGDPPAPHAPADLLAEVQRVSLDLAESRARLDAALCKAGLARREGGLPMLEVGVTGKREDGEWGFGPVFATALPIFDQGQARLVAAHATLRRQVAEHERLTIEVQSAARRLEARDAALRERLRALREVYLPLRERLVREGLQFFNAMQIGAFDVLHAKQQEIDARREHAETLREVWLASLDLAELLAGSLNHERLDALDLPDEAEHAQAPKGH